MSTTPTTSASGHHHGHHRGRRLRNFLLPDGREVHIALSPEEAESLRQRLEAVRKGEPFDLVLNGSPEHLEALRKAVRPDFSFVFMVIWKLVLEGGFENWGLRGIY
jgi:HEAT repeat protein